MAQGAHPSRLSPPILTPQVCAVWQSQPAGKKFAQQSYVCMFVRLNVCIYVLFISLDSFFLVSNRLS